MPAPTRTQLIACYRTLYEHHPHTLLPLETALPTVLQYTGRNMYRTVLTMILSVHMADVRLTQALGKLLARYPDFDSLKHLTMPQLHQVLREATVVLNDPAYSGNGGRLWGFLLRYFGPWGEYCTESHIRSLLVQRVRGFGEKVVRLLQAYCFGNPHVLPLDTPAFKALQAYGLYRHWNIHRVRQDIEQQLQSVSDIALVDLHELLRFHGQAGRVNLARLTTKQQHIITGWNAWRVLISRHSYTSDCGWLRTHLVQSDALAQALYQHLRTISPPHDPVLPPPLQAPARQCRCI
jgi:endonuclease III